MSLPISLSRRLRRLKPRRLGLRSRITLAFALGAFVLSSFFAVVTYALARSTLIRQREEAAITQTYGSAESIAERIRTRPTDLQPALANLPQDSPSQALVNFQGEWARTAEIDPNDIEPSLLERVVDDRQPARMRYESATGDPVLGVGIPLEDPAASYFEIFPLDDLEDVLRSIRLSLIGTSVLTTLLGVIIGSWAARRTMRPLGDAAQAATAIAGGRLDTRIEPVDDPDLQVLADAFNNMASALQQKVERDARFASDVSHELRSPLTTLSASIQVLEGRREEMPEKAQMALDLLAADVIRFQGLVDDLLEISRFDAGAIRLNRDDLNVAEFVRNAVATSTVPEAELTVAEGGDELVISADRRRLQRVLANLLENARHYGGGYVGVEVLPVNADGDPAEYVQIAVEDDGPGVPPEERELVFERFARGVSAGRRGVGEGAGLGLALVEEHVRLHGGRVWVADRAGGEEGARFVIELPVEVEP